FPDGRGDIPGEWCDARGSLQVGHLHDCDRMLPHEITDLPIDLADVAEVRRIAPPGRGAGRQWVSGIVSVHVRWRCDRAMDRREIVPGKLACIATQQPAWFGQACSSVGTPLLIVFQSYALSLHGFGDMQCRTPAGKGIEHDVAGLGELCKEEAYKR